LPENIAALLKDKSFVRSTGSDYVDVTVEGGPGGISEEEGKSNLNQLVDALIAEMTNKHNSSKGVTTKKTIPPFPEWKKENPNGKMIDYKTKYNL